MGPKSSPTFWCCAAKTLTPPLALRARRCHEHHIFAIDGTHSVRVGIDRY
ncbi:hypothetical protein ACJH6J_23935 [Mycobacterium sp. SMC-18]